VLKLIGCSTFFYCNSIVFTIVNISKKNFKYTFNNIYLFNIKNTENRYTTASLERDVRTTKKYVGFKYWPMVYFSTHTFAHDWNNHYTKYL